MEPLIEALRKGGRVSEKAAEALGKIGDPRAIKPLVSAIKENIGRDPSHEIWSAAMKALYNLNWKPINDEEKTYYLMKNGKYEEVLSLGSSAVGPLIDLLGDYYPWQGGGMTGCMGFWCKAAEILGEIADTKAVEPLINKLKKDSLGRNVVIKALGLIGDPRAVEPLI